MECLFINRLINTLFHLNITLTTIIIETLKILYQKFVALKTCDKVVYIIRKIHLNN